MGVGGSDFDLGRLGFERSGFKFQPDDGAAHGGRAVVGRRRGVNGIGGNAARLEGLIILREREAKGLPEIFGVQVAVEFSGKVVGGPDGVVVGVGLREFDTNLEEESVATAVVIGGGLLSGVAGGVLAGIGNDLGVGSEQMDF